MRTIPMQRMKHPPHIVRVSRRRNYRHPQVFLPLSVLLDFEEHFSLCVLLDFEEFFNSRSLSVLLVFVVRRVRR